MKDRENDISIVLKILIEKLKYLKRSGIDYIYKGDLVILDDKNMKEKKDKKSLLRVLKDEQIGDCKRCELCKKRTNIVFGSGNENAKLMFVGEAPGADEDLAAEPFVGRAGKLLEKMILAMGFSRDEVYICNVIKCRPPENRDPRPEEIEMCEPFLLEQIKIIEPKVIVGLGRHACNTLLKSDKSLSKIRGTWQTFMGIKFMPTFHPAYLLRNPNAKKEVWEDLQKVMAVLDIKSS